MTAARLRSRARWALLGAALYAALPFVLPFATADAASCNGASHAITLSDGRANPGTGTPSTDITFRVKYTDSGGCQPSEVAVKIPGVGTYRLSGNGSNYAGGVTFSRTLNLPVGSWGYGFVATSGSGPGEKTATLSKVSPAKVVIKAVPPPPTPEPTPVPTPRPTVAPTPAPSAKPKPKPSREPRATPKPTPRTTATPKQTPRTTPGEPSPDASGGGRSGSARPSESGRATPAGGHAVGGGPGRGFDLQLPPNLPIAPLAAYLAATGGGLWFFGYLLRRDSRRSHPVAAPPLPAIVPPAAPAEERPQPAPVSATPAPPGTTASEANMPRWLRPSVQRGRGNDPIRRRSWE